MAETDIEKQFLNHHKSDHVQFKLKTLPVNPAATQKEQFGQNKDIKPMYAIDLQYNMPIGAHL